MSATSLLWITWVMALALEPAVTQELSLGGATLITLLGVWLCWGAPRYRMSIEELVKDGKLSSDDAHRKIQRSQWIGPAVTIVGVGLLIYLIMR
jgi:ABC-type nickel/cobalt efflux system permease component RcnA